MARVRLAPLHASRKLREDKWSEYWVVPSRKAALLLRGELLPVSADFDSRASTEGERPWRMISHREKRNGKAFSSSGHSPGPNGAQSDRCAELAGRDRQFRRMGKHTATQRVGGGAMS